MLYLWYALPVSKKDKQREKMKTQNTLITRVTTFITVVDETTRLTFVYEKGGSYIEVFGEGWFGIDDIINVYDYVAGKPSIEYTPESVEAKVKEYLAERI